MRERRKGRAATRRRAGSGPKPSKPRKPKTAGLAGFKELWTGPVPRNGYLLERLVAALHGTAGDDVKVKWNDTINGRQFDVTLRFTKAYCDYLAGIECRDFKSRISVDKVEAFVTKCRDAHISVADKGRPPTPGITFTDLRFHRLGPGSRTLSRMRQPGKWSTWSSKPR